MFSNCRTLCSNDEAAIVVAAFAAAREDKPVLLLDILDLASEVSLTATDLREANGVTLLHVAAAAGAASAVTALLDRGATAAAVDASASTAAHAAATAGSVDVLEALAAAGADLNAGLERGDSVLQSAVRAGQVDAVRWLLDQKVDKVNTKLYVNMYVYSLFKKFKRKKGRHLKI